MDPDKNAMNTAEALWILPRFLWIKQRLLYVCSDTSVDSAMTSMDSAKRVMILSQSNPFRRLEMALVDSAKIFFKT